MNLDELRIAFDREQAAGKAAVTREDIPLSYEAFTDEWLTQVLCHGHPGAQVVGHTLGERDEGNTSRRRIQIHRNAAAEAAGVPASVFCKSSFTFQTRVSVGICGGIAAEVEFYRRVRPHLPIEAPTAHWANYDPATLNSVIMLQDMTDVREFCTLQTDMTEARLKDQMDTLARLHARFYRAPDAEDVIGGQPSFPHYIRALEGFGFSAICENGFQEAREVIPADLFARADEIGPATAHAVAMHDGREEFLTHGDVHIRNWYIAADGKMGLADWQVASRGHWSRDVAYTITSATPFAARPALEKPLLQYYLNQLAAHGGPRIPFEDAWQDYVEQLFGALSFWTVTIAPSGDMPDMQPRDSTLEIIRRIAASIADNKALDVSRFKA